MTKWRGTGIDESLAASFYFTVYNFVKIHKTIKTTPAVEAGVTTYLWSMEDIVMMTETMGQ